MKKEAFKTLVEGHVIISDEHGNVLVDKKNAIHPKNMAIAIARGLASEARGSIFKIKLGNGGTFIDTNRQIAFKPPRITVADNDLYNATYVEVVDDSSASVSNGNAVISSEIAASTSTRVTVTAIIGSGDTSGRANDEADSATPTNGADPVATIDPDSEFFFDELGLFTEQTGGTNLAGVGELMLSHLIFSPIEATGSRELTITYTLTISVS